MLIVLLSNCQLSFCLNANAQGASSKQASTKSPEKNGEKTDEKSSEKSTDKVAQVGGSAKPAKPGYIKAEPQADPAGAPTRIHRPGADGMPQVAPPPVGSPDNPMPLLTPPPTAPPREKFPSVGHLESMMFGHSSPNIAVENRLDKLEIAIFQKSSPNLDIEQRIHRLKEVIVGTETPSHEGGNASNPYSGGAVTSGSGSRSGYANDPTAYAMPAPGGQQRPYSASPAPAAPEKQSQIPFFENYGHYDLNQVLSLPEAEKFALTVVNEVRSAQGLNELTWDDLGYKIADEHVSDLSKRGAVSHQSSKGHNPDVRYSFAGGTDSLVESTVAFPQAENLKPTRQLVVKMLETLYGRQDDREAMLFPHANGFAMAFRWTPDKSKLLCVTETLTKHSEMQPIPLEASVGDRIEVKGSVKEPYHFHKLTLAWEGPVSGPPDDSVEAEEALPYFPPLDYEAHAVKSSRDFEKGIRFLQIAGITAAIAGGIFIPPVALAAPLIAASVGASTPKPVSEIPVRGGVKTDGSNFTHHLPLSNQGKEGIYYVTVWATTSSGSEMLPISRRAIIARKDRPVDASGSDAKTEDNSNSGDDKSKRKEKKSKKKKSQGDSRESDNAPAAPANNDLSNGAASESEMKEMKTENSEIKNQSINSDGSSIKESESNNEGKKEQSGSN